MNRIVLAIFLLNFYTHFLQAQNSRKAIKFNNNVNSESDELYPIISNDGKKLFFVRSNSKDNVGGEKSGQDIWISEKQSDGSWGKAYNPGKPLNTKGHNAIGGINSSNQKVFASNQYNKMAGGITTFSCIENKFSEEKLIWDGIELNSDGFFSFYINPKETIMLLSYSTSKGGAEDLYVSLKKDGAWGTTKNLGKTINTSGYEISPYLSADEKTLFFSSNGIQGFGDADIYFSKRIDDTWENWTPAKNLGKEVNTAGFDAYFTINPDLKSALFCSGENTESSSDIYTILLSDINALSMDTVRLETEVNKKIYGTISELLNKKEYNFFGGAKSKRLNSILEVTEQADFLDYVPPVSYMGMDTLLVKVCKTKEQKACDSLVVIVKIKEALFKLNLEVFDKKSGKLLDVQPDVINLNNNSTFKIEKKSIGIFQTDVPVGNKIELSVTQKGYFPFSEKIDLSENIDNKIITKKIELTALETGNSITLRNILFETAKAELKSDSFESLNKLVDMMSNNKEIKILISGHTDNVGNAAYNLDLSGKRVKSVAAYLQSKGIDSSRLKSQGFGSTKPIADNKTEEGKQMNRRVEVTIL
jgi:outer membrane protein OmpA-like peptidoglycan-associated protein